MQPRLRSVLIRYGSAVLIVAVGTALRYWLDPHLGDAGFAVFFAAVVVASWFGGVGPALVAIVLSIVISTLYFSAPPDAEPEPLHVVVGLGVFVFVGVATGVLSDFLRAARQKAQAKTEEALRQGEQMRITLACIGDAVIVTDINGRLTMMNAVAEALTGWSSAEVLGKPVEEVFRISNEQTGQPATDPVTQVLRRGVIVGLGNHTLLTAKDGKSRPIDDSAAPIRDSHGQIIGVVLIFRDVTQRRRSEQALLEADRRKDEFLAILAHELRNPLAPISTALNILRMPNVDASSADWAKDVMERQVQHLVRLVDDLLDVSRIMRGKIELRKELVDLESVVTRAIESSQPLMDAKSHRFSISLPEEPVLFVTDPVRLSQVIGNLLTNAAKYTETGGQIWLSAEREDHQIVVRVRDSGIGIPSNMLPRVFDLFTQVDSSAARSQGGLGIGLTLVKNLVELNGGQVSARSEGPGQGSEFVVRLPIPLDHIESPLKEDDARDEYVPARKRSILVVDDNRDAADTLTTLLRFSGHEVQAVSDGASAVDKAQTIKPDVIFLDIGMPGMDGLEVARRLRQLPEVNNTVLVALTGWGQEEDRRRTKEAGFDYHLVKPVDAATISELLARMETMVN